MPRGVSVPCACEQPEGAVGVLDQDVGGGACFLRQVGVVAQHDGSGTFLNAGSNELVAVHRRACLSNEEVARLHFAGVELYGGDVFVRVSDYA